MDLIYKVVIGLDDYIFNSMEKAEAFAKLALAGDQNRNRITITILRKESSNEETED